MHMLVKFILEVKNKTRVFLFLIPTSLEIIPFNCFKFKIIFLILFITFSKAVCLQLSCHLKN